MTIQDFQLAIIPGLLQTGDYARAVISRCANNAKEDVDALVLTRLSRQDLFTRQPRLQFTYFVHEAVLRVPVGGPTVMADQLHHYRRILASLADTALGQEESKELIATLATELSSDREDHDARAQRSHLE